MPCIKLAKSPSLTTGQPDYNEKFRILLIGRCVIKHVLPKVHVHKSGIKTFRLGRSLGYQQMSAD